MKAEAVLQSALSPLEKSVLELLLDDAGGPFATLRQQVSCAIVSQREFTSVGFFTSLALPPEVQVARDFANATIGNVGAEIPGLEHGAGFLLFIRAGAISLLEGFTYDEVWPEKIGEFRLFKIAAENRKCGS